ncbi:unnamed protein product, partial [marine sediment metagenome]
ELFNMLLHTVDTEKKLGDYNNGHYSNLEVDKLGELSELAIHLDRKLRFLQEGITVAANDIAWIPLLTPNLLAGSATDLDFEIESQGKIILSEISGK